MKFSENFERVIKDDGNDVPIGFLKKQFSGFLMMYITVCRNTL